jgi:glycosyltransferase involved in cell wall biosynthesis
VTRPIEVIPTGLRLSPPPGPDPRFPRGQWAIPPEAKLILYAGRLAREKNLELLFAAFARVAARLPDAWFLITGDGPAAAEARRLAAGTGAAGRIVFAGFVPPARMPEVYVAADVFAFASASDTQGLVLTEAKAAGLPAVAVNAYGPSVVVTDGLDGFLTPNDPAPFAEALCRILADRELRARMRDACLREVCRFSIEATAHAYEELYGRAREFSLARSGTAGRR